MPPVIFHFLNDLSSFKTTSQGKNASKPEKTLIEAVAQMSARHWNNSCFAFTCFASHYFFSNDRTLNVCGSMDEIRQLLGNYRQKLNDIQHRMRLKDTTSTFMKSFIGSIELLPGLPFKGSEASLQDSDIPVKFRHCPDILANIRTDIRNTMKKAGYHPDEEGMCYGMAWTALLACVRQDGQAYMQRLQYLTQMDTPPLPGTLDTHQIYPFFDTVTLSMTSYKNMSGYEKGIGYPGRQEVAFPGHVIGGHESDYQVPVVKQTFIAECTPETFIRFLQQTRKNNNGIPFGVMIHYPGHATSIGFDSNKWLATDHDNHYYTETTELLYSFFDEQSNHYKDGRIMAAIEVVADNAYSLNITNDALVVNAKKSVSAPLALHLALQYGDVSVTTECIIMIGQQTHTPEILLEQLTCKDARGTPGLYMALHKGYADAITAFIKTSTTVITALPLPEAQKAELLHRLFSSKNACFYHGTQNHPQENTGDMDASRKRPPPDKSGSEAKQSKADAQNHPQETTGNIVPSRKRTPSSQTDPEAKRSKSSAVKEKQGTNLQTGTAAQGSRSENPERIAQDTMGIAIEMDVLQGHLKPGMNDTENEAAKKLFRVLNSKKIKIKDTFYKLLANSVDRKALPSFCSKASVFFGSLTGIIKDTGCLTGILGNQKNHIRDFLAREDAEIKYLAGLDTFRCFSSMNSSKGLPKKEAVEDVLGWDVWKPEGIFSLGLLRTISSMNNGKGLPKKNELEEMLGWDVWKPNGTFCLELLRTFSSMNSSRGLLKKEAVEEILSWELWKPEDSFSLELFRAFSSMNSGRGLPKKEAVEDVLGWKVWKPNGAFSMELFRAFSSMNNKKGLPKKEAVEEMLGWDVWKQEGVFCPELFRTFSSMNHGRGLPEKKKIGEMLGWEVWKLNGAFSMELLRAFSSMNHGKGLPKKKAVEAVLNWKVWKPDGVFNLELFRTFSSMICGNGLPEKEAVEAILAWDVWKLEGAFSIELFRTFSSMNKGNGLPEKEVVEEILGWDVWKQEGRFNLGLFRAFSSMNSGKGLPGKEAVREMLDWEVWRLEGVFNMELFRAFSSMNNGKGLPRKETVEAILAWEVWKLKGVFSMELFRAFSSMNTGKGLLKKEAVEALLGWEIWKPEGVFNLELLRAFSSMNHGRGLPEKKKIGEMLGWEVWKLNGVFSMELLRSFASINNGKGLPKKEAVEDVLGWKVWKPNGAFNLELFRAFSSMNNKKGLPKKEAVEEMLGWEIWKPKGVFNLELFRSFSSINHSKGLPKKETMKEMLNWLRCEEKPDASIFKLAIKLYASEGMPNIKKLKQYEKKLLNLFFANSIGLDSDDGDRNEDEYLCLIQPAVLFLSTRKPQYVLNFRDVEYFYHQMAGTPVDKLEKLLQLLLSYGGQGVTRYLKMNDDHRKALLNLSSLRMPLQLTMQAITDFLPQEGKQYLFFIKNLKNPPDKDQWSNFNLKLNRLASVLKTRNNRKSYLEVIWNLAPSDRDTFLDVTHAAHVIAVFPSLSALQKLAKSYSQQKLKALLTACLRFKQGNPSGEEIKRLFAALLETRLPLCDHGDIPDYFLSGYTETGDAATFIPTPPTRTTEKLALYFVAAVTRVLSNMLYHYKAGKLKIEQYAGDIHFFPVPELQIQDKGIKISNWPMEVFQRFLAVTEFPEQYYLSQEEWLQYRSEFPLCFRGSTETCHQEERAATGDTDFQPFSIAMLTGLLKNNIPVKPAAWKSFDYHKDKLPRAVQRQLLGEIEKATHEDIPISLIEYLKARRAVEELQDKALPQNRLNIPPGPLPVSAEETLNEEEQFQRLWADLSRKTLLEDTDLQLLTSYKQYMTMEHIVKILQSAHASIAPCQLDQLRQLLGEKRDLHSRKDPFLLTLNDEITSYLMEAEI